MKLQASAAAQSGAPKYRQIVHEVQTAIEQGRIRQGDQLPSLNEVRRQFDVSRDTVIKAYQQLKALGLISSSPGKGNYVTAGAQIRERNILLLFDEFTAYKEVLYKSLQRTIGRNGKLDLFFHNFNEKLFFSILEQNIGSYTDYIIMPPATPNSFSRFKKLFTTESVYILDLGGKQYGENYPSVWQDFEANIFSGLEQGLKDIRKYDRLVMVIEKTTIHSRKIMTREMVAGFQRFCNVNEIDCMVINTLNGSPLQNGTCYFVHPDRELVPLVKRLDQEKLRPGKDVGIISYNDAPLKEIAAGGITTISADFELMGRTMGELLLERGDKHIVHPSRYIRRKTV